MQRIKWLGFLAFTPLFFCSSVLNAQDVAFFSAVSGSVKVVDEKGKTTKANVNTKLSTGDKVTTGASASASIMYYTGKEVILGANKYYKIAQKKKENTFLSSLGDMLSSMLWGESKSNTMAGATRAWAGDADRVISAIYPSETKVLEDRPIFKWNDKRKEGTKEYVLTIKSQISDFKQEFPVTGMFEYEYSKTAPKLKDEESYVWYVKDAAGEEVSPTVHFSLLNEDDKELLQEDLKEILDVCDGDNTQPQWYLLTSALYRDYGLMKQAENAILALINAKPEMAQAHIMLATLYKETGRLEEAKAQEEIARELSSGTTSPKKK